MARRPSSQGGLFDWPETAQHDLFEWKGDQQDNPPEEETRALIDQLIADTNLYATKDSHLDLLSFVAKFKEQAPFNAMLLHVQKPGLTYAASAADWWNRYRRRPKPDARPLVILRSFGPVAFVFDIQDTDGPDLPEGVLRFPSTGKVPSGWLERAARLLAPHDLAVAEIDTGDGSAGYIQRTGWNAQKERGTYRIAINRNHGDSTRFTTLAHELAHLFLGHLGEDKKRNVKDRRARNHAEQEVEAESTAYLVARRSGITPRSESYLDSYKGSFADLDLHTVMRAAGEIERILKLPFEKGP